MRHRAAGRVHPSTFDRKLEDSSDGKALVSSGTADMSCFTGMTTGKWMLCRVLAGLARSERFELPTLGIEIRCSIQLSYERPDDPGIGATNRIAADIGWQAS